MNVLMKVMLTVMLVALSAPLALAVDAPHDPSNGITCANCHYAGSSINTVGYTNFCNTCHQPGGMAQQYSFPAADAANLFGLITTHRSGVVMNTSHNWGGKTLVVPRAGAVQPSNASLNYAPLIGLSCERCHNVHNPLQSATNSWPFLRMLNDADQMCLDCHSPRNTTNQATGSHPVTMTYTTAIKKFARYTTKFYPTPINANPNNSSSALNLKKGGQILCSTCHGVHYTDSNSATFDNHSSALLGMLTASEGYLLRTDLRGATANAVNICTNCHKGYRAHNGRGQNVQCTDCHGAHVDEGDGTVANVWLVRRYMSYSTALTGRVDNRSLALPTFFQSMATKNYRDANGSGVCQACHALPTTVPEHSQANVNCNDCHTHAMSWTPSGGGSCTSCHGQPPTQNVAGGPDGYAGTYGTTTGVNEALTAHSSHATTLGYACTECHNGATHQSGNYQQVFIDTAGLTAAKNGATPAYNTGARSCATTYCHSNGVVAGRVSGTPVYATPTWASSKGTIIGTTGECVACHGGLATSSKPMATGSHAAHVSKYSHNCKECHSNTTTNGTSLVAGGAHLNGTGYQNGVDIKFDTTGKNSAGIYNATVGNLGCTATYCHSNGKGGAPKQAATWGGTMPADCSGCHGGNATLATFKIISSGKHLAHIKNAPAGGKFGCVACHNLTVSNDTTLLTDKSRHVNGSVDYAGASAGTFSGGTCSAVYCHSNGQATPVYRTVAGWTSTTTYGCASCHGADTTGPAGVFVSKFGEPNYNSYTTAGNMNYRNSHAKHVAAASDCQTCHAATTRSGFSILSSATVHVDKTRNVVFDSANAKVATASYNSTLKTCSNVACHSGSTPKWGSSFGSAGCAACHPTLSGAHAAHIGTLLSSVTFYNYTANKSTGSELTANTSYAFGCANCHPTDVGLHANGTIDVTLAPAAGNGSLRAKNAATAAATVITAGSNLTCSGVYCHSNGQATPTYATAPNWYGGPITGDKCASCHGNSPASGAHSAHVVGIHADTIYSGTTGNLPTAAAVGTAAGHGDPAQSTTLSCNICHNTTISVAYNDKNPACASCHNGTAAALKGNAAITNRTMHVNGRIDLAFYSAGAIKTKAQLRDSTFSNYTAAGGFWSRTSYKTGASSVDSAKAVLSNSMYNAGTCSNIACHNGRPVNWTGDVGKGKDCSICHSKL